MYSDSDIVYAFVTDSANYSRQSYQKMLEKSVDEEFDKQKELIVKIENKHDKRTD